MLTLPEAIYRLEQAMIGKALVAAGGNQTKTAKLLGITRRQLAYYLNTRRVLHDAPDDILDTQTDLPVRPSLTPSDLIETVPDYPMEKPGPVIRSPDVYLGDSPPRGKRKIDVSCHVSVED